MTSLLVITNYKKPHKAAVSYPCQLPVIFNWQEEGQHNGAGFTCDVSLEGALIHSTVSPPVGSDVFVQILIPSPDRFGNQLRVQCTGKVNRVVRRSGGFSFGEKVISRTRSRVTMDCEFTLAAIARHRIRGNP